LETLISEAILRSPTPTQPRGDRTGVLIRVMSIDLGDCAKTPPDQVASVAPFRLLIFDPVEDKDRVHLLKNLEHFLSSFLGSKEFYAALIGAVIGGIMTGRYALRAQKQAANDQRQRDQETEQRAVKGILQAIAAELEVVKDRDFDGLRESLQKHEEKCEDEQKNGIPPGPFEAIQITTVNRFSIFDSNTDMLGKIDDDQLRKKIIMVYGEAKISSIF
jgi:hypothetical protein